MSGQATGKVPFSEQNSYNAGKSGGKTTVHSAGRDGSVPNKGGNPTKSGGITRATTGSGK